MKLIKYEFFKFSTIQNTINENLGLEIIFRALFSYRYVFYNALNVFDKNNQKFKSLRKIKQI